MGGDENSFNRMLKRKQTATLVAVVAAGIGGYYASQGSKPDGMAAALRASSQQAVFSGKTAVVLGATSGIGQGCAIRLAEAGFSVVAVGRDPERGAQVVKAMAERSSAAGAAETAAHTFLPCDAFSLKNIKETSSKIASSHPKLYVNMIPYSVL